MVKETPPTEVKKLPLKALGLRAGMALQTRRLIEGASKKESQFFGAIEGKGVMVGPLGSEGESTGLTAGEVCIVRGFTGQYEYSFLSKVLQTFEQPFVYALLAYPAQVDARMVRHSMRIKTSWPTTIHRPEGPLRVALVDISTAGAMIKSPERLASVGGELDLTLSVLVENAPVDVHLKGAVCHCHKAQDGEVYFLGLAFKKLAPQDKLALHYLTQTPQA